MGNLQASTKAARVVHDLDGGTSIQRLIRYFYLVKPLVPRRLQIVLRRKRARRLREISSNAWPIDPLAGKQPEGWPGWPDYRRFAVILTHDVEGRRGVERVRKIVELEKKHGFRSSFNFVGAEYKISAQLRSWLFTQGFEIGVHGFRHNGLMYLSKQIFRRHAAGINQCLRDWNSVGFRSPAMHRNFSWLHKLDIQYDLSSFDTDPFEPQPDGVRTIFPFWIVDGEGRNAYLELPYTLSQDFTLFKILEEQNINTWKRKIDWIVERGGIVLLNTHPDYICFAGESKSDEYPVTHYSELLQYIITRYAGQYWQALPREVAKYLSTEYPPDMSRPVGEILPPRPLRVFMATYSHYESDNRVRRYAETLARRGDYVYVLSLGDPKSSREEWINGVKIQRIQTRTRDERKPVDYLRKTGLFLLRSSLALFRAQFRTRCDLVHIHNIPDFEVFSALGPKLAGAKVILDIHDIVPELFTSKFGGIKQSRLFKMLLLIEQASCRFADHVIISNDLWKERIVARSVSEDKCSVCLNYPDTDIFGDWERTLSRNGTKTVLYPGTLNFHQGLDIAIEAFAEVAKMIPEAEFHIYGDGPELENLVHKVSMLGIQGKVFFKKPVPIDQIPSIMERATCGIVPKRAGGFGGQAFSTKILEFMSLGIPVLVSGTEIDHYYFNDSVVFFFESGNVADLSEKMLRMLEDENFRVGLAERAKEFVADYQWDRKQDIYLNLVDRLIFDQ